MLQNIQQSVLSAALAVCENAAPLPDNNAQIPEEFAEALGEALVALAELERDRYQDSLLPGAYGLTSAQVAVQRAFMDERSRCLEQAIDAADRLYLAFFDEVIVPCAVYRIKSSGAGIRYLSQESIRVFLKEYEKV